MFARLLASLFVLSSSLVAQPRVEQRPAAGFPGPGDHRLGPPTERVRGILKTIPTHVKSMDAWEGNRGRITLADGRRITLKGDGLVDPEVLDGLDGAEVDAVVAPVPGTPGTWVYHQPQSPLHISQGPVGHGAIEDVVVDGEVVAQAQWEAGTSGGHQLIWIQRRSR